MTPPAFRGGQGRSPESLVETAGVLFWYGLLAVALALVLWWTA